MEKPVQIKLIELKDSITSAIAESELPAFCVTPILKDLYEQVLQIEKNDYIKVKQDYENALKED